MKSPGESVSLPSGRVVRVSVASDPKRPWRAVSYDAKVKVLGEYINHHVVEEHTEMFPKCRRAGMDLAALRTEMEARKADLLPQDAPSESPGLLSRVIDSLSSRT